jgi:putative transposase
LWSPGTKAGFPPRVDLLHHSPARRLRIRSPDDPWHQVAGSESAFKTLKYRPDFPKQFGSIEAARAHCHRFFAWYNDAHRHGGLGLHAPSDVHYGLAGGVRKTGAAILSAAYDAHPERFINKPSVPPKIPTHSWINPPEELEAITQ